MIPICSIVGMSTIYVKAGNTRSALAAMFSGQTTTLQALAALQTISISRATELGLGSVGVGYIVLARSSGLLV